MKKLLLKITLCAGLLGLTMTYLSFEKDQDQPELQPTKNMVHPVLIQLFTSQGCSSCPPADELLGKVAQEYSAENVEVLSYHVDYWDRLGWKDPYSKKEFTQKQYTYGKTFNLNSVYTPQAVVNGKIQFTGSSDQKMQSAIKTFLKKETNATLFIKSIDVAGGKITIDYSSTEKPADAKLYFALVLKKSKTQVAKGENRGRNLVNYNIVIDEKNSGDGSGTISFSERDLDKDAGKYAVIAYIQENNKSIIATSSKDIAL